MELNHKIFGDGKPVIILHGLFGMLDNWQTLGKKLAAEHMVILVDQRDHGRSPHTDDFNYQLLADDLKQFMEDNWIYEASIVGHSMGGKTAMNFALLYPDMVDKLVIVDMAPVAYEPGHNLIFEALKEIPLDQINERNQARDILVRKLHSDAVVQFLLKNLSRTKEGSYRWKMNLDLILEKYPSILESITSDHSFDGETLFIKGGKSDYVLEEHESEIKKLFPNVRITEIPHAGHWVHAEAPKEVLELLISFL